jgi:hypothetical protein
MEFPSVVGSDLERAKCIIKSKLGPHTPVHFVVQPYKQQKNAIFIPNTPGSNAILLWYDERYNAVALTPKYYGRVYTKPSYDDEA